MAIVLPQGRQQFFDANGDPLAGGFLHTYQPGGGVTTPKTTHQDAAGTIANTNPIVLNARGEAAVFWTGGYNVRLETAAGALIYTVENINIDPSAATLDAALRADLADDATPAKGPGLIGYGPTVAYADETVGGELGVAINLATWPSVDPTGAVECGAAIRLAMAEAINSNRPLRWNAGTYQVGPDPASPLAAGFRTYCLKPADGAVWIMDSGATIFQADGSESWCRVVSFQDTSDVTIYGTLKVDANVVGRGATTNEQMHGVFIFDATNLRIDAIDSRNARGDNVFIGGTDEATYSDNVWIGEIYGEIAGRKCLTLHYCDRLVIETAILDNSLGGAAVFGGVPDTTDKHCLDVEPDSYGASKRFDQHIGTLRTYGLGNDFTAGTTPDHGDNWVLTGDDWVCVQSGSSATVPAWEQNAVTVNVNTLTITGCAGIDSPVQLNYAARLFCGALTIRGASSTLAGSMLAAATSGGDENKPKLDCDRVEIRNTVGGGCDFRSASVDALTFDVECAGIGILAGESVSSASYRGGLTIGHLVSRDTGVATTGYVVSIVTYALAGYPVTISKFTLLDTRGTKVGSAINVGAGNSAGLTLGEYISPESIPAVTWASTDKYYRVRGGMPTTTSRQPAQFVCNGTPLGMIVAPVGSIAMRDDGGVSTSLYVKEGNPTTSAGWTAK